MTEKLWQLQLCSSAWTAIAKYHRLNGLNNRKIFPCGSGGRSPRSRCQLVGFWWSQFSGLYIATFSLCPYVPFPSCVHEERKQVSSLLSLSIRMLILMKQGHTLKNLFDLNYFLSDPTSNTAILMLGSLMYEVWWGTQTFTS